MCNGHSTRVSQGGSIAVLRPTEHLPHTSSEEEMLLLFSNTLSQSGTSIDMQGLPQRLCQNQNQEHEQENDRHWIVIHRDGDLSTPTQDPTDPLYSFDLQPRLSAAMQVPQILDLGVGERGIVGRRVSVMRGRRWGVGMVKVAEGVIGWN